MLDRGWVVVHGWSAREDCDYPDVCILCCGPDEVAEVVEKYQIVHPVVESYDLFLKRNSK